jgi:hypothetical protein
VAVAAVTAVLTVASGAGATVTVSRAELNGSRLRIEGRAAANRTISVDRVAMGSSDGSGNFRIERDGFAAPADCTVDVNDGSAAPAPARLSGCTVTTTTTQVAPTTTTTTAVATTTTVPPQPTTTTTTIAPPPTTAPAGLRITTDTMPNGNVGTEYTGYISACCGQGGPYRWSLVAGRVPDGMQFAGDSLRLTQTSAVLGRPTTVQTTTFTVQVRDQSGNTARKTFSLTVDPARPLVITNQSDQLSPGRVGVSYAIGVFADGGTPPYRWSLLAGQLPPGLSLTTSPGRITGTPSTAGTFTFTLRVADQGGQQAARQFSITISP